MDNQTRRKLSIVFMIYNQSRAEARRRGDTKKLEALNKVLRRLVKNARRPARVFRPTRLDTPSGWTGIENQ